MASASSPERLPAFGRSWWAFGVVAAAMALLGLLLCEQGVLSFVTALVVGASLAAIGGVLWLVWRQRRIWEDTLAAHEQRFRAFSDQVRDYALFMLDPLGRVSTWNAGAERLQGFEAREILGRHFSVFFPTDARARGEPERELERARAQGQVQLEGWRVREDGSRFWAEIVLTRLDDGQGHILGYAKLTRDLTERMRAERELRESEQRFRTALDEAPIGMALVGLDGRFIQVNRALCGIVGYTREELTHLTFQDITHPEDLEEDVTLAQRLRAGELQNYQLGKRYVRKDGSVVDAMLTVSVVRAGEGTPLYFISQIQDFTRRKQAEEALRRSERETRRLLQRLRSVLDAAPVGVLFVNGPGGEWAEANLYAERLFGRYVDETSGFSPYAEALRGADGQPLQPEQSPCAQALAGTRVENLEMQLVHPRAGAFPVLVNAAPIRGDVPAAVLTLADISALKELERLRAEWNSIVAHDLRQPVNVIWVAVQLLLRLEPDARVRNVVERIRESTRRLNRMIEDLLDYSRLEARQLTLVRRPVDMLAVVRTSVDRQAQEHPETAFRLLAHGELRSIEADPDRIAQVLDNLFSNALKYGDRHAPVVIQLEAAGDGVSVAVTNQGPDIPPENLPHLFQRFHRTAGARGSGIKGLGLGLYITRELIEAHGGSITAQSGDHTTTFRFWLPATRPADELDREGARPGYGLGA